VSALRTLAPFAACLSATLSAACAPPLLPTDATAAALDDAAAAGGREDPVAAHYLDLAERELARARTLLRVRDAEGARSWARRAAADADVARLLAVEIAVREAAKRAEADAQVIFEKLEGTR
jgi:hypothetical protein